MTPNLISKISGKTLIIGASALLLITLFLYAAYNKLIIYSVFVEQLKESPITNGFQNILAWLVPSVEIILAIFLIFKATRLIGFYGSFFLMLLFTAYVFIVPHFFSTKVPCACGGIISTFTWEKHFYFNLAFTLLAASGLIAYSLQLRKKSNN